MARVSPIVRSFNAGEFSQLMEGRTDLERYPASMRKMFNCIAAPQGPVISRSGTAFVVPVYDNDTESVLVPFIFSNEQFTMLEFASDRIRFVDESGIQVYAFTASTTTSTTPFKVDSAGLNAAVGDDVVLAGFPADYNLNGEIVRVVAKVGTVYTFDRNFPALATVNGNVALVYKVAHNLTQVQRKAIRAIQSVDVMYLLTGSRNPLKLSRYGTYDWRLTEMDIQDGPFMPVNETNTLLTPGATGSVFPNMTADNAPSGLAFASGNRPHVNGNVSGGADWLNRTIYYDAEATLAYYAFDDNDGTYWASSVPQFGTLGYQPAAPVGLSGFTIYMATDSRDTDYTAKDFAPSTFVIQGSFDGISWFEIFRREDYVDYQNGKSQFFKITNGTPFGVYRLVVLKNIRNGSIEPRVRKIVFKAVTNPAISISASAVTGINRDAGFALTDIGRLLRLKGTDGIWRTLRIASVIGPQSITATVLGEPLLNLTPTTEWRLGYWSDTTGHPNCGDFFEDRLWLAGSTEFPDIIAGSQTGQYEKFAQTDEFGVVQDDSAIVLRLNARRLSRIRWLATDERGLLIGTGSDEYVLASAKGSEEAVTPRNFKARGSTRRGSADVEPVKIDRQVLFIQRSGRTVREFAYSYEADGYKSPSMSQLASHMGISRFVEMDYAAEPHSIAWMRREDGVIAGLTYNRDENVVGWHRHDFNGIVESIAVAPQLDQMQDALWMIVKRTIDGNTKRYIERLTRFWDFDTELEDAWFVDCALRYSGVAATRIYGLQHLIGQEVYGLANGRPVGPLTVEGIGYVDLPFETTNCVIGLGYDSEGETSRLDNGASDQGTAMGKQKRINQVMAMMWASTGGQFGTWNNELKEFVYHDIEYPLDDYSEIGEPALYTGDIGPLVLQPGYDTRGSVAFRRPKSSPLPFNIVAIMPKMVTHDG